MRQISKRTQYGLRALYSLARNYGRGPTLITQLSKEEIVPKKYLEQILLSLKEAGFVSSKRGKGGGYALAQPPDQITLGAVIRNMEGPIAPLPCASDMHFRKCDECVDVETCGTRIVMREVRDAMVAILDKTTIATVARKVEEAEKRKRSKAALTYEI